MKIAVIADDLTGANDTGVQFARFGLCTSVLLEYEKASIPPFDTIVIDTDSRSLSAEEAYKRVKQAAEWIKQSSFQYIYKKIDSTLRGNIGAELDALYDAFQPDFIMIAPAYPKNNRNVINGYLYLNQQPLHETEFAHDPKNPITDSYIPALIEKGSKYKVGLLTKDDLRNGFYEKLEAFRSNGIAFILFDSSSEQELQEIVNAVNQTKYSVIWSGSAGLATHLIQQTKRDKNPPVYKNETSEPVLLVIGSVNKKNRQQLKLLLMRPGITGIEMYPHRFLIDDQSKQLEMERILYEAIQALTNGMHVVLFTLGEQEEVDKANYYGGLTGKTSKMVSDYISKVVGDLTAQLVAKFKIERLFLTGGDTAKQACLSIGSQRFDLIDEIEIGLPLGVLVNEDNKKIYAITKAGGFGSERALVHSLEVLQKV